MLNAAIRLLGFKKIQIEETAENIIIGQLRAVIATMDIEEIISDREKFLENVRIGVGTELTKIGLNLINVNIKDIVDESGCIEALGKAAAAASPIPPGSCRECWVRCRCGMICSNRSVSICLNSSRRAAWSGSRTRRRSMKSRRLRKLRLQKPALRTLKYLKAMHRKIIKVTPKMVQFFNPSDSPGI